MWRARWGRRIHAGRLIPRSPHARAALFVAALILALRLPTLLEPYHYTDEGIFAAVAARLLDGHALYSGAWDDKPPGVFWVYALVQGVFGPSMLALRGLAAIWCAATAACVTLLGWRIASPRAGFAAGGIYAVLVATPFIEGNLALTELLGGLPVAAAMLLLVAARSPRHLAIGGVLFGMAALFKQVFILDAIAAGLFVLFRGPEGLRSTALLGGGGAAVLAVALLPVALLGDAAETFHAVFGFSGGYLAEGTGLAGQYRWLRFGPALVALLSVAISARGRRAVPEHLVTLWCGFALTGALMALRPYGHYLVQAAAPAALALTIAVHRALARRRAAASIVPLLAGAPLVAIVFAPFWLSFPMVRPEYYRLTAGRLTGEVSAAQAAARFDRRMPAQDAIIAAIRADSDRSLFVWAELPWLYPLTDGEAPVRYVVPYHTGFVASAKQEVIGGVRRDPPRFIVRDQLEWRRLPGLEALLSERYALVERWESIELYRRRDTN